MWVKRIKLDEEFCCEMDKYLYEKFNSAIPTEAICDIWTSLARTTLLITSKICHIDLSSQTKLNSSSPPDAAKSLNYRVLRLIRQLIWWPNLLLIWFIFCCIATSCSLYYSYIYDKYVFHIRRLRQAEETNQAYILADYRKFNITESALRERANKARIQLQSFGAPFINSTYAPECCYIYILLLSIGCYINPILFNRFVKPLDFYTVRLVLDRQNERRNFNKLICEQCNKYIQSSCNFTEAMINRCIQLNGYQSVRLEGLNTKSELRKLVVDYRNTVRRLKEFALSGKLQPINRTNKWINYLTKCFCTSNWALATVPVMFYLSSVTIVPAFGDLHFEHNPMDVLLCVELSSLWLVIITPAVFYITVTILNCTDQGNLVSKLIEVIESCIYKNDRLFDEYFVNTNLTQTDPMNSHNRVPKFDSIKFNLINQANQAKAISKMNSNMLYALVHYKIFVSQLKPTQSSFGFICTSSLFVAFAMPIIGRLHVPYVTAGAKILIIVISVITLVLADICIAPVCQLNVKCLRLYKTLWGLLAHAVNLANHSGGPARVYDKHTIRVLRKELNHPERLANQFSTIALGLSFTYSNLIRIHFWFGIIVLSIITDVRSDHEEVIGSLASDPLGIFSITLD